MNCFQTGYNQIHLFEQQNGKNGLYKNQIGAIGSALSHFSIKKEPVLIAMPTGTGKTAVMIVLSYLMSAKKVLVITPSQLVRDQIAKQFSHPKLLIDNGVLPKKGNHPRVYELTSIIGSLTEWDTILQNHDVIVGIPGTINKIIGLKNTIGGDAFDLVFVDEAHHSRAKSWMNVLEYFNLAKQILLTATPFRRDKKDIKARLIYNYPLKQAYEDGLFSKINFVPVSTQQFETDEGKNIAIAQKAENIYKKRYHKDHKIIIRTDTKPSANNLLKIYSDKTDLKLSLIHSNLSDKIIKQRIGQLQKGEVDGIICVDMMGEGYDFPLLKIAAIHVPHKSLAITLQFVGRISRTNTEEGSIATVIAGQHEFEIETEQLYKNDTKDWALILPDLHKSRIQKAESEQEFFDSFEDITESEATIFNDDSTITIDDDNLIPFFHAKLYKIFDKSINPKISDKEGDIEKLIDINKVINFHETSLINNCIIRHHSISIEHEVAIFIVSELKKPRWYSTPNGLNDVENQLFIVFFDSKNSILFICSTIKENELYESIVQQYLKDGVDYDMIPMPYLKRVMAGWKEYKMYNIGLKSRKVKGNSESYKQIMGSAAQDGVSSSDKYSYTRGHSFGGGYDSVLDKEMILGISTSSKVWSLDEKKIKYLIEWFNDISRKISDSTMDKLPMPLSDLDSGKVVESFPSGVPFFADWNEGYYHKLTTVGFINNDGEIIDAGLLCSCFISISKLLDSHIYLSVKKGEIECEIIFSIQPKVSFIYAENSLNKIVIKRGSNYGKPEEFLINLNTYPIHIFYEDLSHLAGRVWFEFKKQINFITEDQIIVHAWPPNVNVNKEFYSLDDLQKNLHQNDTRLSIHDYILNIAKQEFDAVFYDHASLEIADVIGFKNGKVKFYHCKKQEGDNPRCSVDDIYEVNGQAIKSVNWAHRKLLIKQICERADQNESHSKIKKGSLVLIKEILQSFENPIIPVEIVIVQPGLKTKNLAGTQIEAFKRIKTLLSAADTFLQDVSSCHLSVMCS